MSLTRKAIEKKYRCELSKDSGFDSKIKYWVCMKDDDYFCDGWTLTEIVEKLNKCAEKEVK